MDESYYTPRKTWVDKGKEFYNRWKEWWLQDNDIEMHSTRNEEKSFVCEKVIKTLKNEI